MMVIIVKATSRQSIHDLKIQCWDARMKVSMRTKQQPRNLGRIFGASKMHLSGLGYKAVVLLLLIYV